MQRIVRVDEAAVEHGHLRPVRQRLRVRHGEMADGTGVLDHRKQTGVKRGNPRDLGLRLRQEDRILRRIGQDRRAPVLQDGDVVIPLIRQLIVTQGAGSGPAEGRRFKVGERCSRAGVVVVRRGGRGTPPTNGTVSIST